MNRRSFIVKSIQTVSTIAGLSFAPGLFAEEKVKQRVKELAPKVGDKSVNDISVIEGKDYFKSTIQAIEKIGGISKFVSKGDRVGILVNSYADNPGTYTYPDITLAVAYLCYEAGAKQVYMMKNEDDDYWELSKLSEKYKKLISNIKPDNSDHVEIKVDGKVLKKAEILKGALEYERLFNLPIIKHHSGVHMTCTLKNMMGLSSFSTNIRFHFGEKYIRKFISNIGNSFPNLDHFAQSLADLNKACKVDLCVVDATNFIIENGPRGPGKIRTKNQVVAGTDRVAIDVLCCDYLGLNPADIHMIKKAYESKLGEKDLSKLKIDRALI